MSNANETNNPTIWHFLALIANAWPILIVAPFIVGVGVFLAVRSAPSIYESTTTLHIPLTELLDLPFDEITSDAVSQTSASIDSAQVRAALKLTAAPDDAATSVLTLRLPGTADPGRLLDVIARRTNAIEAESYLEQRELDVSANVDGLQQEIDVISLAIDHLKDAVSLPIEAYGTAGVGGMADIASVLANLEERRQYKTFQQRMIRSALQSLRRDITSPAFISTEMVTAQSASRTAALAAIVAEMLLMIAVVLRARVKQAWPNGQGVRRPSSWHRLWPTREH